MESKASLGVYLGLGVSVDVQDKKIQHFTPLLDTISSKIAQWRNKCLSQSAKLIIINSILSSLDYQPFGCFSNAYHYC